MWGKILFFLLLFSVIPASGSPAIPSQLKTNQAIQLYFDQPISSSLSQVETQDYFFTLYTYLNITLTIETNGNLTVLLPNPPYHVQNQPVTTNFANFTWSAYLRSGQSYYISLVGEPGHARDYTISLSRGNPVIDHNNHNSNSAYPITEHQVVNHVLNYTSEWISNWYNFTFQQDSTVRINLQDYYKFPALYFLLRGPNLTERSGYFHTVNISESLVVSLKTGNYTIQVMAPIDTVPFSWPYQLWFTTQYQLQAPTNITTGDPLYGTITDQKTDMYNLTVTTDSVIWFYGSDLAIYITIANATSSKIISPYFTYVPTNVANMKFVAAGNYTVTISTALTTYVSYYFLVQTVQPDFLESTDNSQDNPFLLVSSIDYTQLTLHLPMDHDWFKIQMPVEGTVQIVLTGNVLITVHNGTNSFGYQSYTPSISFGSGSHSYILDIYSNNIAVLSYSISWSFSGQPSNYKGTIGVPIDSSSSELKVGYPFVEMLGIMLLPIEITIYSRKHKK